MKQNDREVGTDKSEETARKKEEDDEEEDKI